MRNEHKYPCTCEVCGKSFLGCRVKQRFCSRPCCRKAERTKISEARREGKKNLAESAPTKCLWCGSPIKQKTKTDMRRKFCSTNCGCHYRYALKNNKRLPATGLVNITRAEAEAVAYAQDHQKDKLWEISQTWTPAQRAYAKKRYEQMYLTNEAIRAYN